MVRHAAVRAAGSAAGMALTALALVSCDSGSDGAEGTRADRSGPPVVAPGRPGEANKTLSPREAAKARPENEPNTADVAYVRNMIHHHRQALAMTDLAADRARARGVRSIADRIAHTQGPEVGAMRAWLKRHGQPQEAEGGHDHTAMPGMATPEQLAALRKARGAAFDKLFLKLMITHHEGAVTMATDVSTKGNDVTVEEMASDVIATQSAEIGRMRRL
ncbi:DUF305 domain-containing protein [Wenjunlia tyrosinilytica]|nr:DUF305 domain-containing protein [Wenjunlia tyrosinilytica]